MNALRENGRYETSFVSLRLIFGDARKTVQMLAEKYDVIFLDGFSPDTNPELWTADFVAELAARLQPDGVIATYSSAYPLFGAFLEAGLNVFRSEPFGRKRPGTVASKQELELMPLSAKDTGITLRSTAGVPYRDPGLEQSRETIFAQRKEEVARLRSQGVPKWYSAQN